MAVFFSPGSMSDDGVLGSVIAANHAHVLARVRSLRSGRYYRTLTVAGRDRL
jgi:hypothetical protein